MQVIQVDVLDTEPLQRGFDGLFHVFWTAVQDVARPEAKLTCKEYRKTFA